MIGIRVLAAGALSGIPERHPTANGPPEPIGSSHSYAMDLERAKRLIPLVAEGFADSLAEAAICFAISHQAMGTVLVGMATIDQFEASLSAILKGPTAWSAPLLETHDAQGRRNGASARDKDRAHNHNQDQHMPPRRRGDRTSKRLHPGRQRVRHVASSRIWHAPPNPRSGGRLDDRGSATTSRLIQSRKI